MRDDTIDKGPLFSEKVRDELEKLTVSINDIMENLRKMESPIIESRESLPKANAQLDKISAQTEKAAHQMLDMVEQIIEQQEKAGQLTDEIVAFFKKSRSKDRDVYSEKVARLKEIATLSQNNAFLIMDALQFQDITAQQMNHASTLLEDIEGRLQNLLNVFDGEDIPESETSLRQERAFDPDADLFDGKNQSEVDSIVSQVADKG